MSDLKVNSITGNTSTGVHIPGHVVQVKNFQTGAVATGTTVIPLDNTIPQNTEGNEFLTLAFTPTSATNKLYINVHGFWSSALSNSWLTMALFQDDIANAITTTTHFDSNANGSIIRALNYFMTAGTTSETIFKVRVGNNASTTVTMNGISSSGYFVGAMSSGITIMEIAQ
jgi:hypothetical protein